MLIEGEIFIEVANEIKYAIIGTNRYLNVTIIWPMIVPFGKILLRKFGTKIKKSAFSETGR